MKTKSQTNKNDIIFLSILTLLVAGVITLVVVSIISDEKETEHKLNVGKESEPKKNKKTKKSSERKGVCKKENPDPKDFEKKEKTRKEKYLHTKYFQDFVKYVKLDLVDKGGKIFGVKISKISKRCFLYRVGLKKGDIILKFNKKRINNLKIAFSLLKLIAKSESLCFIIKRNGRKKVINYK